MADGVILYEGPTQIPGEKGQILAVATGLERPSENRKTGRMVQIWILPRDWHPSEAVREGHDSAVCGSCSLRPSRGGGCYVVAHQGPASVWRTAQRGGYAPYGYRIGDEQDLAGISRLFQGRYTRWGAWGDPMALPPELVATVCRAARRWTGYTHQWRKKGSFRYRPWLMASVETEAAQRHAHRKGWRTFRIHREQQMPRIRVGEGGREVTCLYETHQITCDMCGMCSGTAGKASFDAIGVTVHGYAKNKVFNGKES